LDFHWNRTGLGKLYYLTEAGETAVRHNFQPLTTPIGFDVYLPDVLAVMSGGWLVVKDLPEISLSEVVEDLHLRRVVVEMLLEQLVTAVHPLLTKEDFTTYKTLAQQFHGCLLHVPVTENSLKQVYHALAFWGGIAIEAKFMAQLQPLLYALWLVAAVRLEELKGFGVKLS
jgi:hypothetical protein